MLSRNPFRVGSDSHLRSSPRRDRRARVSTIHSAWVRNGIRAQMCDVDARGFALDILRACGDPFTTLARRRKRRNGARYAERSYKLFMQYLEPYTSLGHDRSMLL